jgi:hypothetical protein
MYSVGLKPDAHFIDVRPVGAHGFLGLGFFIDNYRNLGGSEWLDFSLGALFCVHPGVIHAQH